MPGFTPGHLAPTGLWTQANGTGTDTRIVPRIATGWAAQTSADTTQSTSPAIVIAPVDNDLVVIGITIDVASGSLASSVISCNAGQTWTKIGEINDSSFNDHRFAWFYRKWQAGDDTSITFTCNVSAVPTAVEWALAAVAYGGTSDTTPIGTYAFNTESAGANTPNHSTKTISPAGEGSWIGYIAQDRTGSSMTTPPSTYTNRVLARPTGGTGVNPSVNIGDSNRSVVKNNPVTLSYTSGGSSIVAGNLIFEIVAFGQSSNPPPQLSLGPVIGAVSDTSVTVTYAFSGLATTARLAVTTDSTYVTGLTYSSSTSQTANGVCKMTVTGLTADTTYYVAAEGDGALMLTGRGSFKTLPTAGAAANFSLAFSSCQFTVPTSVAFAAIKNRVGTYGAAKMLIHMGDIHYRDWPGTTPRSDVINQWFDSLNSGVMSNMLSTVPATYCWDNHDWGGVDSDATNGAAAVIASAFREVWPHYALPATDNVGAWQTWVVGRVRFIQIDPRSQRVPRTDAESSSKTMLGVEQKAWLKARLQDSEPVKIICGNMYWRSEGGASGDRWSSYSTEWTELTTFINSTSGVTGRVYVLFGDTHALCADNGTTSTTGGIPQAGGAPLQQGALPTTAETWSQGYYTDEGGAVIQCYGWLDVTDTGSLITIDYSGVSALDGVTRISMSTAFSTSGAGAAAITGAGSVAATGTQIIRATATVAGAGTATAAAKTAAALSTLIDDFNDGSVDFVKWPNSYGSLTETGGRTQIPCTTTYSGLASPATYLFDQLSVQLFPPAQAGAAVECYMSLWAWSAAQNASVSGTYIGATIDRVAGTITFVNFVGFSDGAAVSLTYDPVAHAWVRMRRSAGDVLWETAPDGSTWTTRRTVSSPPTWLFNNDIQVFVECHRLDGTANTGEVDNFNVTASTIAGTATITGAGTTSAAGAVVVSGSASATGAGSTTAAVVLRSATVTSAGAGAVTAAVVQRGQATVAGVGTVTASVVQQGSATVTGAGTATAGAAGATSGTSTVAGAGAVTATAVQSAVATVTGAGSSTALATLRTGATATGAGTVSAGAVQTATSTVAGVGTVVAGAQGTNTGAATSAGVGAATALASVILRAPATVTGAGTATAAGSLRGTASPAGAGAVTALVTLRGTAAVAGIGTAVGSVGQTITATAAVAGAGAVAAAGATRFTPRPNSGTTARPGSGTTVRPFAGTTARP